MRVCGGSNDYNVNAGICEGLVQGRRPPSTSSALPFDEARIGSFGELGSNKYDHFGMAITRFTSTLNLNDEKPELAGCLSILPFLAFPVGPHLSAHFG